MTSVNRAFLGILSWACLTSAVSQQATASRNKSPVISASLAAEHGAVKAGTRITVKLALANRSDHVITFGKDARHEACGVDVLDEAGKFAPDKKLGYHHGRIDYSGLTPEQAIKSGVLTGNMVWITLKPGEVFPESVDVSKLYDMTSPGVYSVSMECRDPETAETVNSNVVRVAVTK